MKIFDSLICREHKEVALKLVLKGNLIALLALLVLSIFVLPLLNTERVLLSVFFALSYALHEGKGLHKFS